MSGREFNEWMAYERVAGTLGPERDDLLSAMLTTLVFNLWRGKNQRARKVSDFIPEWDQRPQSADDQLAVVRWLNKAFGGDEKGA